MATATEKLKKRFAGKKLITTQLRSNGEYRIDDKKQLDHFINYSSILTRLIQEAGTVTTSYASDLFISWESFLEEVEKKMATMADFEYTTFLGFRQRGVDGPEYIEARLSNPETYGNPYLSIFQLDLVAFYEADMYDGSYEIVMTLSQVFQQKPIAPIYEALSLVGDRTAVYLLPADGFSNRYRIARYNGEDHAKIKERAEIEFYCIDPKTIVKG
ncbi:hypothetical protein LKD70_14175 [Ruminococcus sp. CLA-AA-H200]|uniref:Uncharacterized protein n=1 Tax=Ruminococcus turbiniformis TaxID=2881258 RepID=A0ABS8G2C0_9FIRM|nr:hypothetical protein [Ruminococcus turbiniformis]MCC2255547.1 hypothetical protein [Ruminococcus turbiniformis]